MADNPANLNARPVNADRDFLMKLRFFVTGTSAALAVWLGVTFVRDVPRETYPHLGKGSLPITANATQTPSKAWISLEPESDEEESVAVVEKP